MNSKIKISIIVPVYNVENYIEECLYSIISQTLREIEIILIDDGSTDNSYKIMESFAETDNRILLFSQSNQGVSAARNRGISKAKGEFILFMDSDDIILPNTLDILYGSAKRADVELIIGNGIYIMFPNGVQSLHQPRNKALNSAIPLSGVDTFIKLVEADVFPTFSPLFFIKRNVILKNRIFYKENCIHEDELWTVRVILKAKSVLLIDFSYYIYRQRAGSLLHSGNLAFRVKSLFYVSKALHKLTLRLKKVNVCEKAITAVYIRIFTIYYQIKNLLYQDKTIVFHHDDFFIDLLINIYPILSHSQQEYCFNIFYKTRYLHYRK